MTTSIVVSGVVPANRSRSREDTQLTASVDERAYARGEPAHNLQYRLDVVATDVADVVRSAGGWLYDRVAAGWEVNVLLPPTPDARALQILGVRALDLDGALSTDLGSAGVAVSAAAFAADARARDKVRKALDHSLTEVTLWGDNWPLTVGHVLTAVQHPLSAAARAFKRQALTAAGLPCAGQGLTETFISDLGTCLPVDSDLAPATRTRA